MTDWGIFLSAVVIAFPFSLVEKGNYITEEGIWSLTSDTLVMVRPYLEYEVQLEHGGTGVTIAQASLECAKKIHNNSQATCYAVPQVVVCRAAFGRPLTEPASKETQECILIPTLK